uniref:Uncharacterized protein LOC111128056 isoform X1 n=1 Tax=Crassostrea virginica TaxID=6565 RepID=A0A8B8DQA8_CRAVI|nr:uncharacterized protein LOC111128056 isoform X1 [Crassostrea virginica]
MENRFLSVFGHYIPYPITVNKGGKDLTSCTRTLKLQILSNNELRNYEIVTKLRHQNTITLSAVCEWISKTFDGVLDSVTEEQDYLKFVIRIFSEKNVRQFYRSWNCNKIQYELQRILLDKELFLPRENYGIRFVESPFETSYKSPEEMEDGNESDDSAYSSLMCGDQGIVRTQEARSGAQEIFKNYERRMNERIVILFNEMQQKLVKEINSVLSDEKERLSLENKKTLEVWHAEIRKTHEKFETLNDNVMGMEARIDKMSNGRFQHVFQKVELTKRLLEQSLSKLVELESTTTETNALVYELQQKFESLRRSFRQSARDQTKEIQDFMSAEHTKIENLIKKIQQDPSTEKIDFQEIIKLIQSMKLPMDKQTLTTLPVANGGKEVEEHSKLQNGVSDLDIDTKPTLMSTTYENAENIPMSKTSDTVELKQTVKSDCLSDDKNLGQVVSDVYPSLHVARPLSPTLAKALEEYEGDPLVSDREELEDDGENKYEPVNFEESEDLSTCTNQNLQDGSELDPTVDNSKTSGEECISDSVQAAKIEPSQATFQPQVKTIEKIQTAKSYCSEEVTMFLKDPEEIIYNNDIGIFRQKSANSSDEADEDNKDLMSECDTDVEDALKASGLQKSKPVVQIVKKALKEDSPMSRLHGLDTIICVDLSNSLSTKVLHQVQATLHSFLDTVEEVAIEDGLEENLGLVTFGRDTKIRVQLTNDYGQLRNAIETMSPGGTSPLHTALSLCQLELQRNGHATCIHEHCIAPRIILFTDGRPTTDLHLDESEWEDAPKDPQKFEEILSFVQQLGNEGFQLFTVGVGRQTNTEFLGRLSHLGGGEHYPLDDTAPLAKYFKHQFITGKIIHEFRESGWYENCQSLLQKTVQSQSYGLDREDIDRILVLLHQSEEMEDIKYPGLPKLGSRVLTKTKQSGTVIKHRKNNWVKVQFDLNEGIIYLHYIPNAKNCELEILDIHQRLDVNCVNVGTFVDFGGNIGRGYLYDKTNSGYIKVNLEKGSKKILRLSDLYSRKLKDEEILGPYLKSGNQLHI